MKRIITYAPRTSALVRCFGTALSRNRLAARPSVVSGHPWPDTRSVLGIVHSARGFITGCLQPKQRVHGGSSGLSAIHFPLSAIIKAKHLLLAILLLSMCLGSLHADPAKETVRKVLDNGLTVVVRPEKGSGLVAVVAMVKVGAAQEGIQTAGIGNFVAQLLLAGTRQSSADEVAAVADEVGGNIESLWHPDFTEIRVVTTSAMFNRAMSLLGECLNESNFEDKYVETVRADLLKRIHTNSDNSFLNAYDNLRSLLYQDNGYKRPEPGLRAGRQERDCPRFAEVLLRVLCPQQHSHLGGWRCHGRSGTRPCRKSICRRRAR